MAFVHSSLEIEVTLVASDKSEREFRNKGLH